MTRKFFQVVLQSPSEIFKGLGHMYWEDLAASSSRYQYRTAEHYGAVRLETLETL